MKNFMEFFRRSAEENAHKAHPKKAASAPMKKPRPAAQSLSPAPATAQETPKPEKKEAPQDGFTEWCRSKTLGGVERRERNDIFEAYNVYGADEQGRLCCRRYHRYPEHEREFGLSYSRALSFDEFNTRLLGELDKSGLTLNEYHRCIAQAQRLSPPDAESGGAEYEDFTEEETAALHGFCEALDTLKDKQFLHSNGIFSCEGESVVGGETLYLRFRKPIRHDALHRETAGVKRETVYAYDIDDLWIMGVCNRLSERCDSCSFTRLSSAWSAKNESVYLAEAKGFPGIEGALLCAVGTAADFFRFGFYSLDFNAK